jgi:hypothetical protein
MSPKLKVSFEKGMGATTTSPDRNCASEVPEAPDFSSG